MAILSKTGERSDPLGSMRQATPAAYSLSGLVAMKCVGIDNVEPHEQKVSKRYIGSRCKTTTTDMLPDMRCIQTSRTSSFLRQSGQRDSYAKTAYIPFLQPNSRRKGCTDLRRVSAKKLEVDENGSQHIVRMCQSHRMMGNRKHATDIQHTNTPSFCRSVE